MVLGGPLCGWLLGLANPLGLPPWRFMFLIVAIPNAVVAIAAGLYLVDRPQKARWLSAQQRTWLEREFELQEAERPGLVVSLGQIARDSWLWRCAVAWLLIMTGSYALVFWLPQLVRSMNLGGSEFMIATISALPLLGLAIGLVANGRRSDRKNERLLHVALPSFFAGSAMLFAAFLQPGWLVLALLFLAGLGIGAAQGVFWAVPGAVKLGGARVPVGVIALISMFGTAGGVIGPWLTGALLVQTGSFSVAIGLLASLLIAVVFVIGFDRSGRARS
jgi:ACS family tartrate transporter-like MFS transporter